jgi:putative transposase
LRRCARLAARRARIRRDWQHKAALDLARRFGMVFVEDLNIQNMTASARGTVERPGRQVRQKSGLNRSILDQSWGVFETLLTYKLDERGGMLVKVDPAYTSQTCSDCGAVDARSRESQASFVCVACGFRAHADTNAAINIRDAGTGIRRWNTPSLRVEDGRWAADETRTTQGTPSLGNPPASAGGRC